MSAKTPFLNRVALQGPSGHAFGGSDHPSQCEDHQGGRQLPGKPKENNSVWALVVRVLLATLGLSRREMETRH